MKKNYIAQFFLLMVSLFFITSSYSQNQKSNSWLLNCKANNPCFISQKIQFNYKGESKVIGGASVFYASKNLILRLRMSPNANKEQGVGLKIDKNKAVHLPITTCDVKICEVNVAIDNQLLSELRSGKVLSVVYFDDTNKQKALPVFLDNFNELFDQLNKV